MRHLPTKKSISFLVFLITALCGEKLSHAADFFATLAGGAEFDSNVYKDENKTQDFVFHPDVELGIDFKDFWTAGYQGSTAAYAKNSDLFFHRHELFIFANPAWGKNAEHEFFGEVSLMTQRNTDTFRSVNLLEPSVFLSLTMEPVRPVRWTVSTKLSYRWFYDDNETASLDSWTRAAVLFTAKTRTTVTPKFAFGNRFYPNLPKNRQQSRADRQIETGIHLSQGIVEQVGIQADWTYLHAFDESVAVLRSIELPSFNYIGEEFLFTGHAVMVGLKSVFETGVSFGLETSYAYKSYLGWPVLDDEGTETDGNRTDHELSPAAWVRYTYFPGENASRAAPETSFTLSYVYLRQWSNDAWYDTDRHLVSLRVELLW